MFFLRQNTDVIIMIGPFLDSTDGNTPEPGLTINDNDYRLSKNGGSFAPKDDSDDGTHDENGWYSTEFDGDDIDSLGMLKVAVHVTGALPVWADFMVVPDFIYDFFTLGTGNITVDILQSAADKVWGTTVRTLSTFGTLVADIWASVTRTLTAGTKDSEIDLALQILDNKMFINETTQKLELYNAAGDTVIRSWPLTDRLGNPFVLEGTGPANRDKP